MLRNEAYNKRQELEHPDFMYWDNVPELKVK